MRVGIDARAAVRYRGTGLGTYTARLIEALAEVDQLNEYCAFLPSALGTGEERGEPFNVPAQGNFRSYTFPASPDRAAEDLAISRGLAEGDYDLHHVPHNGLGYPPEPPCPVVTTVHDLIPYVLPQTCTRRYLERFLARMPEICARSSLILTVSRRTRADLCQILGLPAQKIVVVYEAPEPCYQPGSFVEASARMSERYGLPSPYLLYVGGFSPRKHLTALLTAYAKVYRDLPGEPALVLAGSPDPAAQRSTS
jgi:glycosyltransferase involved in cell wall biosynthesis